MNWFMSFYFSLSYILPVFGMVVTLIALYLLNKIARELKRMNDLKEK